MEKKSFRQHSLAETLCRMYVPHTALISLALAIHFSLVRYVFYHLNIAKKQKVSLKYTFSLTLHYKLGCSCSKKVIFKGIAHQFWIYNIFFVSQRKKHFLWKVHLNKTTLTRYNWEKWCSWCKKLNVFMTHLDWTQPYGRNMGSFHSILQKIGFHIIKCETPFPLPISARREGGSADRLQTDC